MEISEVSEISKEDIDKAINTLKEWVDNHLAPDDFVVLSSSKGWTPRSILEALQEKRRKEEWGKDDFPETVLVVLIEGDKKKER